MPSPAVRRVVRGSEGLIYYRKRMPHKTELFRLLFLGNARSKFWGDDGRAGFKNWEEVTDPRNPLGGRQGVDERIMLRESCAGST